MEQWRIQDFPKGCEPTYYMTNFSRKLHEERERPWRPLRSATVETVTILNRFVLESTWDGTRSRHKSIDSIFIFSIFYLVLEIHAKYSQSQIKRRKKILIGFFEILLLTTDTVTQPLDVPTFGF